jgi:UDP-GlcNAc:undecaprenyl-phosphate GlcNAc-1-phosphate transferase
MKIFPLVLYFLTFLSALIVSAFCEPLFLRIYKRFDLVDNPGQRKIHTESVPLSGGIAVLIGIIFPLLIAVILYPIFHTSFDSIIYGLERRKIQLLGLIGAMILAFLIGLIDDIYELKPLMKFIFQAVVAFIVAFLGVRITLFVPSTVFSYLVTIFWFVALMNAFNFIDNMNGLCAGLCAFASFYFASISAYHGQYLVALICFLVSGAFFGFIPFNFPKAKAFLGDSGSHLAGFLMALISILPHFYSYKHPYRYAVLAPLVVLAVPLIDMIWVVVYRILNGKPFYCGDTNHLSHKLVALGLTRSMSVLVLWLVSVLFGFLGFCIAVN